MDALVLEQGGGLDLNIVCEEASKVVKKQKKVRKQNKYEKRRAKARQAKGLAEKESVEDTRVAPVAITVDVEPNDKEETGKSEQDTVGNEADTTEEQIQQKPSHAFDKEEDAPPPVQQHPVVVIDNNTKSRKVHIDTLQDKEERARYMAEFHARPMEMDRRSGAVSTIAPSRESEHIFDQDHPFTGLHSRLASALTKLGAQRPTFIQTRAMNALKDGRHNLFIQSETGSGKTLAYLLPILQSLAFERSTGKVKAVDRSVGGTRCIILCPTRELASQTAIVAEKLCVQSFAWIVTGCLSGGEKRKSEKARIRKGISILIATPGRLLDHLGKTESLLMALKGKLEWLVLDEADRLLDMGLGGQVEQIVQHVRSNQPGSGPKRDGVTWNSVLVSATVTNRVEGLAKKMLGSDEWLWVRGGQSKDDAVIDESRTWTKESGISEGLHLADSTPRQLGQLHITVSAKLRLATLVAFLAQRVKKNERTVVFMSTCDGVDYHEALFSSMGSILPGDDDSTGIFGKACPIFKLHGSVPHAERQAILQRFGKSAGPSQRSALLLATDVAARGLNLPGVDWAVQYDPPCEIADYVHRAGRTARAGKSGHSLLFLLPSERAFLDVLEVKGVKGMSALSLASTLNHAASICGDLTEAGEKRSGGGYGQSKAGRSGEAFCSEIQSRLEECVMDNDAKAKADARAAAAKDAAATKLTGGKRRKKEQVCGPLLELARKAFSSYIRSYPTKEKAVRHIFSARALHLGHIARSFALKDPPKALVKSGARATEAPATDEGRKRKSGSLTFQERNEDIQVVIPIAKRTKPSKEDVTDKRVDNKAARALLHARAARLQEGGMDI